MYHRHNSIALHMTTRYSGIQPIVHITGALIFSDAEIKKSRNVKYRAIIHSSLHNDQIILRFRRCSNPAVVTKVHYVSNSWCVIFSNQIPLWSPWSIILQIPGVFYIQIPLWCIVRCSKLIVISKYIT